MIKKCCICKQKKSLSEFHKDKNKKDGLSTQCKSCGIARAKVWNENNKERVKSRKKKSAITKHGITQEQYEQILAKQKNVCAICGNIQKRLCIDHDHSCCSNTYSCGKCIRGLLCNRCNLVLGMINEDLTILENMKKYIGRLVQW